MRSLRRQCHGKNLVTQVEKPDFENSRQRFRGVRVVTSRQGDEHVKRSVDETIRLVVIPASHLVTQRRIVRRVSSHAPITASIPLVPRRALSLALLVQSYNAIRRVLMVAVLSLALLASAAPAHQGNRDHIRRQLSSSTSYAVPSASGFAVIIDVSVPSYRRFK